MMSVKRGNKVYSKDTVGMSKGIQGECLDGLQSLLTGKDTHNVTWMTTVFCWLEIIQDKQLIPGLSEEIKQWLERLSRKEIEGIEEFIKKVMEELRQKER